MPAEHLPLSPCRLARSTAHRRPPTATRLPPPAYSLLTTHYPLLATSRHPPATPADILVGAREDAQMHRRATAIRDFYRQHSFVSVPEAEHELWHPNYLQAIKTSLSPINSQPVQLRVKI